MHGFHGRVLHIDLTNRTVEEEVVPDEVLQKYLGGKGLAAYLMLRHLEPSVDPLSHKNKIIFATGPVADTRVPAGSRFGVYAKSPLTGFFGESYSGGHVAPVMKRTGYDAIMVEGVSSDPVYLHISDEGVEFGDASDLWGEETYATEDALLERAGERAQALVIGPAGENLVKFACIKNNYWRSAGRTGMGAVMGSKKLKGMVFSGSTATPLADADMLNKYVRDMIMECKDTDRTQIMRDLGTPYMVGVTNSAAAFPTRYWHEGSFDKWEGISSDAMAERMEVRPNACHRCFMACGKMSKVIEGPYEGLVLEGPEYETIYALGGLCCIEHIDEVAYLNDLCDRLGLDTITGGNVAAFAIEAGLRGKLDDPPAYGDTEAIARLFKQIANREDVGDLLSGGVKDAAEKLDLEDLAVHVKGLEPAGYDPRTLTGMTLGYAVSGRGACHLRSSFYMSEIRGEASEDLIEKTGEFFQFENRNTLEDTLIICRFYQQFIGWDGMQQIIEGTTGARHTKEELVNLASGVTTLVRRFNLREGLQPEDDTLPTRLYNDPIGPNKDRVCSQEDLETMRTEYYRLHGWDESGVPLS